MRKVYVALLGAVLAGVLSGGTAFAFRAPLIGVHCAGYCPPGQTEMRQNGDGRWFRVPVTESPLEWAASTK